MALFHKSSELIEHFVKQNYDLTVLIYFLLTSNRLFIMLLQPYLTGLRPIRLTMKPSFVSAQSVNGSESLEIMRTIVTTSYCLKLKKNAYVYFSKEHKPEKEIFYVMSPCVNHQSSVDTGLPLIVGRKSCQTKLKHGSIFCL